MRTVLLFGVVPCLIGAVLLLIVAGVPESGAVLSAPSRSLSAWWQWTALPTLGAPQGNTSPHFVVRIEQPPLGVMRYVAADTGNRTSIVPDDKWLLDWWKGSRVIEEASALYYYAADDSAEKRAAFRPVPLNVTLDDVAGHAGGVTSAYLEVAESISDNDPIFWMDYPTTLPCGPFYQPKIGFENFGWGELTDVRMEWAFVDARAGDGVQHGAGRASRTTAARRIKQLLESKPFFTQSLLPLKLRNLPLAYNFEGDLARFGVRVEALKELEKRWNVRDESADTDVLGCRELDDRSCLEKIKRSGLLGDLKELVKLADHTFGRGPASDRWRHRGLALHVIGRLVYRWRGRGEHQASAPFIVTLQLALSGTNPSCGDGEGLEPDQDPRASLRAELLLDRRLYRVPLPIRGSVAAGGRLQFSLLLQSPKSARHRFRFVAELNNGQSIRSKEIDLLFFVPSKLPWSDEGR